MTDKTEPVELTLDKSGILCNMLMEELIKPPPAYSSLITPEVHAAFRKRLERLWLKLAATNDKLRGML